MYQKRRDRENAIDMPQRDGEKDINWQSRVGIMFLIGSIRSRGHNLLERVKVIIELMSEFEVDVNLRDSDGYTALLGACSCSQTEVALELLKVYGIDVNLRDSDGYTALMMACSNGLIKVALELLKIDGIDVNVFQNEDECTALMYACLDGLTEVVEELLKIDGIDVNIHGKYGTALMRACSGGHTDIALALLQDSRVDRQIRVNGQNALELARQCRDGSPLVVARFDALDYHMHYISRFLAP